MSWALKALDLSHHNTGPHGGPIDFGAIAGFNGGQIKAVVLKATQGNGNHDPTYTQRKSDARAAGLLVGAYHFNTGAPVQQQVDNFFSYAQPDDQMMVALDFEDNSVSEMSLDQARQFLELGDEKLGRKLWLYTGNRFKDQIAGADDDTRDFFGQHPLWLAQYDPEPRLIDTNGQPLPWAEPTLWQFSGDGVNNPGWVIPGVDPSKASKLDMNAYGRSDELFEQDWTS